VTTPADRTAALSRMAHDEYLTLGGLSDIPACEECQALSGLLTGLVRMAREVPSKAEYIEALVAEAAETLGLVGEDS
jgi:predicted ester cyclase